MPTKDAYHYLSNDARADLAAALPFLARFARSVPQKNSVEPRHSSGHGCEDINDHLTLLASEDMQTRITALLQMPRDWCIDRSCTAAVFRIAFGDPDTRVRGVALAAVAAAARAENLMALRENARLVISERFPPPRGRREEPAPSSICEWIELLPLVLDSLRLDSDLRASQAELNDREASDVASLAGEELEYLVDNPNNAAEFLNHRLPARRRAGLLVTSRMTGLPRVVLDKVLMIARSDPDPRVRLQAVQAAVRLCRDTADQHAMRTLATIVKRDLDNAQLWSTAYAGLFDIEGRPYSEWPGIRALEAGRDPYELRLEDIDWEYVAACLGQ